MPSIRHTYIRLLYGAILATWLLSACGRIHECWGVWPEPADRSCVNVTYIWPDAYDMPLPEGMTLIFYPADGSDYWRFDFPPQGGTAALPPSLYDVVSYNSDTENVVIRGADSPSTLEATTITARITDGLSQAYTGAQPPSRDSDEPVRRQPDVIWLADSTSINLPDCGCSVDLPMHPHPIVGRYTILIDDITNLSSASGMSVSLSGLAGSYMLGLGQRGPEAVTMPGSVSATSATGVAGDMLTFGPAPSRPANTLCLYVWLRDGSKKEYRWDVTSQIEHPADGHCLTIHISGLTLPEVSSPAPPSTPGGGISVGVDNWETIEIELST